MDLKSALEITTCTDPGMVRSHNEDSVAADAAHGVVVLADGMGGYNAGEVASGMATTVITTTAQPRGPVPDTVEGLSLISTERRDHLYGEHNEDDAATRMIRWDRYKLIYYPVGNHVQLFDLETDPDELHNLAAAPDLQTVRNSMTEKLVSHFYGNDLDWVQDGDLTGLPDQTFEVQPNRSLQGQRGWRFM